MVRRLDGREQGRSELDGSAGSEAAVSGPAVPVGGEAVVGGPAVPVGGEAVAAGPAGPVGLVGGRAVVVGLVGGEAAVAGPVAEAGSVVCGPVAEVVLAGGEVVAGAAVCGSVAGAAVVGGPAASVGGEAVVVGVAGGGSAVSGPAGLGGVAGGGAAVSASAGVVVGEGSGVVGAGGGCPFVLDVLGRDVQGEAAVLRGRGAVSRVVLPGGVGAWVVTDAGVMRGLLTDGRVSKDAYRHWPAWRRGEVSGSWPLAVWVSVQNLVTSYGAEHRRLRGLMASAFTARRVALLGPRVEEIAGGLLDGVEEAAGRAAGGVVDVRELFALPLPGRVMLELFGIPEEFRGPLREIIDGFFDTAVSSREAQRNYRALYSTMGELVAFKRRCPGEDLTSALIAAGGGGAAADGPDGPDGAGGADASGGAGGAVGVGGGLSEKELVDNLIMLLSAGCEPTVNLLGNAVALLLGDPGQLELVRSGRVSWGDVVEEAVRVEAPGANAILRYAVEDVRVGETVIERGDALVMSFAAAGRDPGVHGPDAEVFDVTRGTRREHLSFGHGVHYCLGAPLARLEAEIALRALFGRFPGMRAAFGPGELPRTESFISNGPRVLPVVPGPAAAAV
ncbi:cytochrome P450 family protein [Streptomyces fagopyri]|uniref:cytochrome P450 family protein n=1 Tax=Streptomyces fagopyri TaxID=2662397 RepID=UPI0033DD4C90